MYIYTTTHAISLYNQLCKAAPLHSEMRNEDLQKWVEYETIRELPSDLQASRFLLAEDPCIPSQS